MGPISFGSALMMIISGRKHIYTIKNGKCLKSLIGRLIEEDISREFCSLSTECKTKSHAAKFKPRPPPDGIHVLI